MSFRILKADEDRDVWDALFDNLTPAHRDVHFTSAYARVQEALGTKSYCAVTEGWDGYIMQPFTILPDRAGEPCDIKSLYGFGGPIASASEMTGELVGEHQENLRDYARSFHLVSEYCCLNPLFADKQCKLTGALPLFWTKPVVVVDLERFDIKTVSRRVRRGVKTALELGAVAWQATLSSPSATFWLMYCAAMEQKGANTRWRFNRDYIVAHQSEPIGAKWFFADTNHEETTPSRALLTIGVGDNAYAHFMGGTMRRLDELLYCSAIDVLRQDGFKKLHLGGGMTNSSRDSLLLFKGGFSNTRYMVGSYERVFDWVIFAQLTAAKEAEEIARHGRCSKQSWFPTYRREFV